MYRPVASALLPHYYEQPLDFEPKNELSFWEGLKTGGAPVVVVYQEWRFVMDMPTYFALPEFKAHSEADFYYKTLGGGNPLAPGEIREGMLEFNEETACSWGGPYPCNTAHFMLVDQRVWSYKFSGQPLADAREAALETVHGWLSRKPSKAEGDKYREWLDRIEAGDADIIHIATERGTQEYPIRIWVMGNDDTSYSKWFKTVEEAEALLTLMEGMGPLDFAKDFMAFEWTFTN